MRGSRKSGKKPLEEVEALRESEEKYRILTENPLTGIFIHQDERYVFVNDKFAEIHGYRPEELLGEKFWTLIHPDETQLVAQIRSKRLSGREAPHRYEMRRVKKDGQTIWCEMMVSHTKYMGKPAILGNIIDITERKKAEEALRENEERLKSILDSILTGVVLIDAETHKIADANPLATEMIGLPKQQIIGKVCHKFICPAEEGRCPITDLGQAIDKSEHVLLKPDGREVPIIKTVTTMILRGREYLVDSFVDITERKNAEKKLLEYQEQLKSLSSELTLAEERERRRIATELHDRISQSLVISKMKLEALRKSGYGKAVDKALEEVCNSLGEMIQDTRSLTFDLSSPILYELGFEAAVAEWLTERIKEKHGIATEFEDDGLSKPLDDDIRILLFRDVRELLTNVVRHADAHRVKVSIRKVDSQISVSVEDDGVGFDPAEAASMAAETNGFGLFSIREQLEELGGHLEIKSAPGRGSRVTMMTSLKQGKITNGGQI